MFRGLRSLFESGIENILRELFGSSRYRVRCQVLFISYIVLA